MGWGRNCIIWIRGTLIHHYQVFSPGINRGWYLWAGMTLTGQFADTLQKSCPDNPVITSKNLHPDIRNAVKCLYDNKKRKDKNPVVEQAYVQILHLPVKSVIVGIKVHYIFDISFKSFHCLFLPFFILWLYYKAG